MPDATRKRTVIALCVAGALMSMKALPQSQNARQAPSPTFEAASVKPDTRGPGLQGRVLPGRLVLTYASLKDLVAFAYGVRNDQIAEGLSWMASDHYDIEATAAGNASGSQMAGAMLQSLLEERFKLALHRETRQLPVYGLAVVKNSLKLQPTKEGTCIPFSPDSPPQPPSPPGTTRLPFCGFPRSGRRGSTWTMDGEGIGMAALAESLSRLQLGRSVIDETGLTGSYDVHLKWGAEPSASPADDQAEPSIFTSLREQLGLRMEAAKGPVEVLVIDHAERPSEN